MPEGMIFKAISGFYYVKDGDRQIQCRARGVFRKRKITPLVGDRVVYEAEKPTDGYILSIDERKNELIRPPIANIDQAILVFSADEPAFDPQLLDRFLVIMEARSIPPVICVTKWDLVSVGSRPAIDSQLDVYRAIGYAVLLTSSRTHLGMDTVQERLSGAISVVTGQSGVGKSSLLNAVNDQLHIDTQAISRSLGRGKHTTRHVELLPVGDGYVADTPGFSALNISEIPAGELERCFPDFDPFREGCRFRGCTHIAEPDCAVKEAVGACRINSRRYQSYCTFFQEINQRKRRY